VENLNNYFCVFLKTFKIFEIDSQVESYPIEPIMDAVLFSLVTNGAIPALISKINGTKISKVKYQLLHIEEILINRWLDK
jgi:hypothetical protein